MNWDVLTLSRIQFAMTVAFHYLFPPLTIGLGWVLVIIEGMYIKTKDHDYEALARFLTGLFALTFAVGVATGIPMEFQFGTNWAKYSRFVGDVFGSALAAEGIFAFFLESSFLAILVFGWDRVTPKVHFISTVLVALGAILSSIWIIVANSWQQTPAGYHVVNGRAEVVDFWAVVFNPSTVHRVLHVWLGAGILGSFFVLSIASYYLLKRENVRLAQKLFKPALVVASICSFGILFSGHGQADKVAHTQPPKLAAFEGLYKTPAGGAPLYIWGFPNDEKKVVQWGIPIPGMLSFLVHFNPNKPVDGLDKFPADEIPPVALTFYTYHIMVGLGIFFIAIVSISLFFWWKGTLFQHPWLFRIYIPAVIGPFLANEMGWAAAEIGRQPWIVWKELRTADAFSPVLSAGQVAGSIVMFACIYFLLFILWLYILKVKIDKGPSVFIKSEE